MPENRRDERWTDANDLGDLLARQRVECEDHRAQNPSQVREYCGFLGAKKRMLQDVGVQQVDTCSPLVDSIV